MTVTTTRDLGSCIRHFATAVLRRTRTRPSFSVILPPSQKQSPSPVTVPASTLNRLFTAGYIAKGAVYLLIGGLTLAAVLGFSTGGGVEGPRGIIKWLNQQTFGSILVGALGLGLLSYALWRLYGGVFDPKAEGHDAKSAGKRVGYVASGLANGGLAALALRLAFSDGGSSGGGEQQSLIRDLLALSWGSYLLIALGVVVIGTGVYQAYKGYKADWVRDIHWRDISRETIKRVGRFGHFARGVVFAIIGYFVILTGVQGDASTFKGTEGALEWLTQHSYGIWLLGLTSVGLLLYGVFSVLKGYYGSI